ncbi:MAG: hypothetical protein ABI854_00125 [Betaproteobacteria bacterium]
MLAQRIRRFVTFGVRNSRPLRLHRKKREAIEYNLVFSAISARFGGKADEDLDAYL